MSETAGAFLVCGLLFSAMLAWGLATGKMLSQYFADERGERPFHFWMSGAANAVLALVCFYVAWVDW